MEQKKNSNLPIERQPSIIERIQEFIEERRICKFYKYAQLDTQKDRKKALEVWDKMSDNSKIKFIMDYTTTAWVRSYDIATGMFPYYQFYRKEFAEQLIDDLWKNSNYNVQKQTSCNVQYAVHTHKININAYVVDRNWEVTDPKLQKEVLEKIINCESTDGTLMWRMGFENATNPWKVHNFKCKSIINKMEGMAPEVLLEMYDSIMQFFDDEYVTDENLKKFAEKLPKNVKKEKVETTYDYLVRDDKLFAEKWGTLSYEEKIAAVKEIFSTSIYEHVFGSRVMKDTNIIRRMYPHYYKVNDPQQPLIGEGLISYDPKVIKRIISDIRGDDLDRYLGDIIGEKQANPFTICFIWNSLDRRAQIKYYDQIMGLLEDSPKSQYELWSATQANSENQRKKQKSALSQVQTIDDIENLKIKMRFLIKGVSQDTQGYKIMDKQGNQISQEEGRE